MGSFRSALAALALTLSAINSVIAADTMSYLDNGVIRLGVDRALGATITYLATSASIGE